MKEFYKIVSRMKKLYDDNTAMEKEIDSLSLYYDRRIAYENGDIEKYKSLVKEEKENEEAIKELSQKIYFNKILIQVLTENAKYAVFCFAKETLLPEMEKYNGKSYGEKTKEKLYAFARSHGFSFYFDCWLSRGYTEMKIYPLGKDGCHYGSQYDFDVYATDEEGKWSAAFVTADNKINASAGWKYTGKYYKNPVNAAKKIKSEIALYSKLTREVEAKRRAFDDLLPKGINHPKYVDEYHAYI